LGNTNQQVNSQQTNPMQMVQELKNNPANFLKSRGFNIPNGVNINDPQSIINGLMQSGQVGNNRLQQVMKLIGRRMPGR
jgi:hypothetical protein